MNKSPTLAPLTDAEHREVIVRRLQRVAGEMDDIAATLDNGREVCGCCGLVKYNNMNEHQMCVGLRASASKLRKALAHRLKPTEEVGQGG